MNKEASGFLWSESRQWLIFPIYDDERSIILWQARNFGDTGSKYYTFGPAKDILHIIGSSETLVLTEDLLSAIKVGRHFAAMPLWGSNIPLETLRRLYNRFSGLGIWLDMDKSRESLLARSRGSQIWGTRIFSIITERDPKEYNDREIVEIVTREINATRDYTT